MWARLRRRRGVAHFWKAVVGGAVRRTLCGTFKPVMSTDLDEYNGKKCVRCSRLAVVRAESDEEAS